jgi:hypothetical protein
MSVATWSVMAWVGLGAAMVACTPAEGRADITAVTPPPAASALAAAPSTVSTEQEKHGVIEHLVPRRDSSGPMPKRFEWTPVNGADHYAMGIWSEVDMLVWRSGEVTTAFVDVPKEVNLDAGTYFWSVTALQDGRPIADSGHAAFIVVK